MVTLWNNVSPLVILIKVSSWMRQLFFRFYDRSFYFQRITESFSLNYQLEYYMQLQNEFYIMIREKLVNSVNRENKKCHPLKNSFRPPNLVVFKQIFSEPGNSNNSLVYWLLPSDTSPLSCVHCNEVVLRLIINLAQLHDIYWIPYNRLFASSNDYVSVMNIPLYLKLANVLSIHINSPDADFGKTREIVKLIFYLFFLFLTMNRD